MATQTLSTADAILKDLYRGPIIDQLNYKTFMLDQIERDSDSVDFSGRRAIVPVHARPNFSPTSITDGGTLPAPGYQEYADAIISIKYHAGAMEITDQATRIAKGNEGAFVNLLEEERKRLAKDMRKSINRQVFGDGTGLIATVTTGGVAATALTLDTTQYLRVGSRIDVALKSSGALTNGGSTVVTAINRTTKVITVSPALAGTTPSDSTYGVYNTGAYGLEMDGLRSITNTTGTLHGINRATAGNEYWQGTRVAASGATAGESLFEQLADAIGANGEGDVEVFLTSRGVRRRLADTYQSTKRFVDAKAVEIHGGYTAIMVNEIPVIADDDVPKGWVFALRKDAFKWFQVDDPDWLKSEDGVVFQLAPGSVAGTDKAAWRAYFVWYAALGSVAPNRTGAIPDAADDAATTY